MKNRILVSLIALLASAGHLLAQGENNIWTFGLEANSMINFNTPSPTLGLLPDAGNTSHWASAVCYPNGQLRFFARLKNNFGTAPEYYLFDSAGNAIAGSDLNTDAGSLDFSMPVIIPRPGNADQYYIFHCKDDGLFYSLLDMSLNNGAGGVVTPEKNIPLTPPGSIFTRLIEGVKGCDGSWLVIRSQIANEYYSFHVRASGIDTQKVISPIGNFPLPDYSSGGFLKASPDGSMLATTGWAGVEWYDFEQCSGKLKNPKVLDTTGNPALFPGAMVILPSHGRFTGVCFSPDNTKLYVTKNKFVNFEVASGELYQFDLSLGSLPAIIASKVLITTNQPFLGADISGICGTLIVPQPLGEIKAGPDGRIYIDNGSDLCMDTALVPIGYNPCPGFHAINFPNIYGTGCLLEYNVIKSPASYFFYASGFGGVSYLQNEIVVSPAAPDTVSGIVWNKTACFKDSLLLLANPNGHCYSWDDGSKEPERTVTAPGRYYVSYYKNCQFTTDTFAVSFVAPPHLEVISNSCEGQLTGKLQIRNADNSTDSFHAIWKDAGGNTIQDHLTSSMDELNGLGAGNYSVQYVTLSGCDTTLFGDILVSPAITVSVSPIDTTIRYGDSIILHASGAMLYLWWPAGTLNTATGANAVARPLQPTRFSIVGIDQNGCRDTAYVNIDIDFRMHELIPNAFSPNGDGLNDVFGIEGITYQRITAFKIFNRFGQQIFSGMDGRKGWDGSYNGSPCEVGTYYYLIQLAYPNGEQKTYKGDVSLIR